MLGAIVGSLHRIVAGMIAAPPVSVPVAPVPLIFTVDTTKTSTGSTADTHFKLPLVSTGIYEFSVDWGDSSSNVITAWNDPAVDHTYSVAGVYTVTITGACWGWSFNGTGDCLKPKVLSQWGNGWRFNVVSAWSNCQNLTITATDVPIMSGVTSMLQMFTSSWVLTDVPNLPSWDTSGVTTMQAMFQADNAFNGDIGALNVSNVQSLSSMFSGCDLFNRELSAWDVSKVTTMNGMFSNTLRFNNGDPANNQAKPGMSAWDVSSVLTATNMFLQAGAFNQNIGGWRLTKATSLASMFKSASLFNNGGSNTIDGWDVSAATSLASMFQGAVAFNQDIARWNVESVTNFGSMFQTATAFKRTVGAWWPRSASSGFTNMFVSVDMNSPASPTNLLTNAQDFTNAAWTKTNLTATADTTAAPDGTVTADSLIPSASNSTDHSVKQTKTVVNGTGYTVRVAVKAKELTWAQLICTGAITANVYVNLSTGAIESSVGTVSVTDMGGGWYVLEITGTASTTSLVWQLKAWNNASGTTFAGNASDAIYAWQASAFDGGSVSNYSTFLKDFAGWAGAGDGSASRTGITAATVSVGGSGYTVGDVLNVVGGTLGVGTEPAQVRVATTDGSGAVLTVTVKRGSGNYDTQPANAAATTGGTGAGCTLTLTWGTKFAGLPASKSFHGGNSKYSMKDRLAMNARKSLVLATGSGGKGWTITDGGPI